MSKTLMTILNLILAGALLLCAVFTYKHNLNKTVPSSVKSIPEQRNSLPLLKKSTLTEIIQCIKTQEDLTITKITADNASEKNYEIELVYEGTINSLGEILNNINRECSLQKIESIEMKPANNSHKHIIKLIFNR